MKYFSMFSGIGGFELGIQQAYERLLDNQKTRRRRQAQSVSKPGSRGAGGESGIGQYPVCVGYSEIDKYAIQIYQSHFNHKNYGDCTNIDPKTLPDFDLLCGGFPCQSFSIARKRKGFGDTRGTLFFEIARIAKEKQPRLLLLENVKGLLSHDGGRTFRTIIGALDELGYDCQWQVLNSKNFGVPQNRERIFIIGHLRGRTRPKVFPIGCGDGEAREERTQQSISGAISTKNQSGQCNFDGSTTLIVPTIRATQHKSGDNQTLVGTLRTHKDGNGFRKIKSGISPTIPARAREDGSGQPVVQQGMKIRRLTPTECERLQGFPDGWTRGASDTQRYKCLGNAVTVNVVREIAKNFYE